MSKQPTIAQTLIAALQARGYTVVEERDRLHKYTVMHHPAGGQWIWIGAAGACRRASIKRFDASVPVSDQTRAKLLAGRADNLNATAI